MIYCLLSKKMLKTKNNKSNLNKQIIEWFRNNIQKNNLEYQIKFVNEYIFEQEISEITNNDYVFWNPYIAGKNLALVQEYKNSIVVIERQTNMNQKLTHLHPINENLAVNYGFFLMYLDENEAVSTDWRLAVQKTTYLMTQEQILQTLLSNPENFKKQQIERQDAFEDLANFTKDMIDF